MCVCVCVCPLKYLLQLYVSCGNSQLSSTQKLCRWLLFMRLCCFWHLLSVLEHYFPVFPPYPYTAILFFFISIVFIQYESRRYQTPWLASCLPSFLEHLLPCTVARVMRCPLRMPNHSSIFLLRFHSDKSEIKHAAFWGIRHDQIVSLWEDFSRAFWFDNFSPQGNGMIRWLTHMEVQVLLLIVDEFDFVLAILNEERIKLK